MRNCGRFREWRREDEPRVGESSPEFEFTRHKQHHCIILGFTRAKAQHPLIHQDLFLLNAEHTS